jgi:sialate O-acetylesterase
MPALILCALIGLQYGALLAAQPNSLFTNGGVLQRGMRVPVWGAGRDGEPVTVQCQGQSRSTVVRNGKWRVDLAPLHGAGPVDLRIQGDSEIIVHDLLIGEVWLASGQSNMDLRVASCDRAEEEIANSANFRIRLFQAPREAADEPKTSVRAAWTNCMPETVRNFSGVAYFFARDLQKHLGVPIGIIDAAYGGTPAEAWMSRQALQSFPNILEEEAQLIRESPKNMAKYEQDVAEWKLAVGAARSKSQPLPRKPDLPFGPFNFRRPTGLYQGMIQPLAPYAIRGVIWYQGERNSPRAYEYRKLFPALIANWRDTWAQGDFPFLFVQLAPFGKAATAPQESVWAELREAQLMTSQSVPNTAMAVITDGGEEDNIHPIRKQPVGARLALAARALAYQEKVVCSGPVYAQMRIDGERVILSFTNTGAGLESRGGPLTGFTIAGPDRKFVNARAAIAGNEVVVSSSAVKHPVAVRYGWAAYPVVNLWNRDGLPASPFRTDDYPGLSWPK